MRASICLVTALCCVGCYDPSKESRSGGSARITSSADPAAPESAPSGPPTARKPLNRKKISFPPPLPPPPRPAGEPQSPEDLAKLAEQAATGHGSNLPGAPPVERIDETTIRIGKVRVDRKARRVEIPGRLNQIQGILEYYAVGSGGKLHESVLELYGEPSHIHLALILAGIEPNQYQPDPQAGRRVVKGGGKVMMFVEWTDAKGRAKRQPAEAWLYNRKRKGAPSARPWTFQGSGFYNGQYMADSSRSIVGLIPDDSCVVGTLADEGNPYQGGDLGYEVFAKVVPPLGTGIVLALEVIP